MRDWLFVSSAIPQDLLPFRTGKRGRPRIHPDRKAYKADHERKRRAKLKDRAAKKAKADH